MKLLRWIGLFVITAVLVLGSIIWINREAFTTVFKNRPALAAGTEFVPQTYSLAGLVGFVTHHPEWVSVYSVPQEADTASTLELAADTPRVMGNLSGLIILPFAIRKITAPVQLEEILRVSPEKAAKREHEALKKVATGNTLAPELLFRIAFADGNRTAQDYVMLSVVREITAFLSSQPEEERYPLPQPWWSAWIAAQTGDSLSAWEVSDKWQQDENWRTAMASQLPGKTFVDFDAELAFIAKQPRIRPRALVQLMQAVTAGTFPDSSDAGKTFALIASFAEQKADRRDFVTYAALFDTQLGQLSGVDFGVSAYDERTKFAQAVFFDAIPVGLWLHMSSNYMNQDFQQRLIWDPGLRKRVGDSLNTVSSK
jgi:hypothetical protein